ncbi:ASCH domain-containing protein [Halosegnis marinus]|uniref:ASCH domain-containing protein n=1 Tax=Halosegnis marinus TaxID=3034023 RepID=A0ABD5ZMG2_9EURY|nr:ASCH domain-containing protein [Halosegnis sp. DT85]
MTEIAPDDLLPNDRVTEAVAEGRVTQLTRGASNRYAEAGDTFALDGDTFEVTEVEERKLGDMTDGDAEREGSPSLDAYKARMKRAHPGGFEWDDDADVLTYRFERVSA